jgi:branched-subunit amino acid ABC-type transport system permease component
MGAVPHRLGLSLIFGVTRIVNFAHGSFYMLAAYMTYSLAAALPAGPAAFYVASALAALATGLIGLVVEVTLLRRVYRRPSCISCWRRSRCVLGGLRRRGPRVVGTA